MEMNKIFHLTFYLACGYLSMLRLKLIHLVKGAPSGMGHYTLEFLSLRL